MDKEIIDGNRLIAEFMGLKRGWWIPQDKPLTDDKKQWCDLGGRLFLADRVYYDKDLIFHSSWDWLMPVVEKIEKLGCEFIISTGSIIITWDDGTAYYDRCFNGTKPKIETLHPMIVKFIKWHNEQNP